MSDNKRLSALLLNTRFNKSTVKRSSKLDDFYSDRSRIIYSSSFRRLQQKAQVFSLEPNASVRTRMTHSLEVADVGRTLSNKIALGLQNKKLISVRDMPILIAIVENACLLHDIGNPPFGHFGETAIKEWANNHLNSIAQKNCIDVNTNDFKRLASDFLEFDGNPQGFRIITKLHTERDKFGLNLSFATLLSAIKYARSSGEQKGDGIFKKAGYFQSEKPLVEKMYKDIGRDRLTRFPLTYIMEAADDISYCLSDISDGIEKRIITIDDFKKEFEKVWNEKYGGDKCPIDLSQTPINFNLSIAVPWSKLTMNEAANNFIDNYSEFFEGKVKQLIPEAGGMNKVLETIKQVSRNTLYASIEAESIELTGYAVITGILEHYQYLLELPYNDFKLLLKNEAHGLDYERRLFNRIGKRYLKAYGYMLDENYEIEDFNLQEWWARVHLIIDHISGMTDEFALNTYQMLKGIKLLPL